MNDAILPDDSSEAGVRPLESDRIVIKLPYAISNMAFIQSLPFWILVILGILGFLSGFVVLTSGEGVDQALGAWIGSAVCFAIGAVGLFVLRRLVWRWALEGYSTAITLVYVFHLVGIVLVPLPLLAIVAFVFLPMMPAVIGSHVAILLVPLVICGIFWVLALMNLFEREIWSFARLDGCCPKCRQWRFGRVRQPQVIRCANCGAELQFERAD